MKLSGFLALTPDGYIAGKDGSIDYLDRFQDGTEDAGYGQYFLSIDAILMGRETFETVCKFPEWPYSPKPVYVLSTREVHIPERLSERAFKIKGKPEEVIQKLIDYGYEHIYVDGGKTISSFIRSKLLNEITISFLPLLLGDGIPLFSDLGGEIQMELLSSKQFQSGIVQNIYKFIYKIS